MTGRRAAWGTPELATDIETDDVVAALAESTRLALYMELHRESSYVGLGKS